MKKVLIIIVLMVLCLSMSTIFTLEAKAADSPPVGYWKFDEGTGTIASDSSGNGNIGTLHGPQWVNGRISFLKFDGVNDYVSVPHSSTLDVSGNQISVEYWMKLSTDWYADPSKGWQYDQILYDKGNAYTAAMIRSTGHHRFNIPYLPPYPETNKDSWTANTWYHIADVFDGNQIRIYVNGVLDKAETVVGSVSRSTINLAIGAHCYGDSNFFNGAIDEFTIYNYARTSAQILNDYELATDGTGNTVVLPFWAQWYFWTNIALAITTGAFASTTAYYRKKAFTPEESKGTSKLASKKEVKICPSCGAGLPVDSVFCGKCGTRQE
jgi:hypothetical protein